MKYLRMMSIMCALLICCGLTVLPARAEAPYIVEDEAVIYAVDDWAQEYLELPDSYPQSFQIQVENAQNISYKVISGSTVTVSDTGLVTPKVTAWYWNSQGVGTNMPDPDEEYVKVTYDVKCGVSKIRVNADGQKLTVTVEVQDYATVYAEGVIDQYVQDNFTDEMTLQETLNTICEMPAGYDYSPYYSSSTGMIVSGGGDCWASTYLILKLCDRLGLEAVARNGSRDPGAGSGHRNVLVTVGEGEYYELDAGYSQSAPRYYSVTRRSTLFCYKRIGTEGGIEVYQYDGTLTKDSVLEIPETIDGKTVESIGEKFLCQSDVKEVIIPDTVKSIKASAFNSCTNLQTLHLPASVQEIGEFAFTASTALTDFTCSSKNLYFSIIDGVLYDRGLDTVIAAPACSEVALPGTVDTIGTYAFYYNTNLTQVELPTSVINLEEGAFANCGNLSCVIVKGNTQIGEFGFAGCDALESVAFYGEWNPIGEHAFHRVTANVCYPGSNGTWTEARRTNYAGTLTWVEDHCFENGVCVYCDTPDPAYGVLDVYLDTRTEGEAELTVTAVGETTPAYTGTLTDGSNLINGLLPGDYVLTVSKPNYATRSYTKTIAAGKNGRYVTLFLRGDVNGDDRVTVLDVSLVYGYARKSTDLGEYELCCADVNNDGKVNVADASKVYAHARKTASLW